MSADVRERVGVRVEELEHVVAVVRYPWDVEHDRGGRQVQVTHRVQRVDVRLHEHLVSGLRAVQLAVRAELVKRRVGEVVGDGDARLLLRLALDLHHRIPYT